MAVETRDFKRWAEQADRNYAQHELTVITEDRVRLARPESGIFGAELHVGGWGTLIIIGDGPDMMFRSYRNESLYSLAYWVGHSDLGYIGTKIVAGKKSLYSGELARADYRQYIDDMYPLEGLTDDDGEVDEHELAERTKRLEVLEDDLLLWGEDDEHARLEVEAAIYRVEEDAELLPLGMYPSVDFRNARALCRRYCALFDAQRSAKETC